MWSREDHPPRVDNPGHLALVVAPQVGGYKFTKVLMDGGSSINILYYETFRRMGLTDKSLKQSNTIFHDVVPGKSASPVGKIELEVAFGDEYDSRAEKLTFEVVKIRSPYHALFGRRLMLSSRHSRVIFICSSRCRVIRAALQYMRAEK